MLLSHRVSVYCSELMFLFLQTNTFQCVVVTDGEYSFALFLYLDQGIQWGEGAQMGISSPLLMDDATPANWSFSLPGALTKQSVDIESTTNTGTAGKWAFRIDTDTILQPHGKCDMEERVVRDIRT